MTRAIARLNARQRDTIAAALEIGGEVYVPAYSVPDTLTKSYAFYRRRDPLNRLGLAICAELQKPVAA